MKVKMNCKKLFVLAVSFFLLNGCANVGGGSSQHGGSTYTDRQEHELKRVAAQGKFLSVKREQDTLQATFRGKDMFVSNSAVLMSGPYDEVRRVAKILSCYKQTNIVVAGHSFGGDEAFNQSLSQRRANAVKNALIQRGVDPSRIQIIGFGESKPISDNDAMNRRVELTLTPVNT